MDAWARMDLGIFGLGGRGLGAGLKSLVCKSFGGRERAVLNKKEFSSELVLVITCWYFRVRPLGKQ